MLFVPVTSMPLSALFEVSNPALKVMPCWSSPSIQFPRSPSDRVSPGHEDVTNEFRTTNKLTYLIRKAK